MPTRGLSPLPIITLRGFVTVDPSVRRLKFQKLPAPFPRRDFANLTNDGVVLLRKCREEKLTFGHYINFCLVQFVLNV